MLRSTLRSFSFACFAFGAVAAAANAQNQALKGSVNPQTGYIDLPASPLLSPASITIEAWITYDDAGLPAGWIYPTIARKDFTQGFADWFLRVDAGNAGNRVLRLWVNGAGGVVNVSWPFAAGALVNWTHVAATYDGSAALLYVNGVQVAQATGTGALVGTPTDARLGAGDAAPGSANERWNGLIDEVRIWSKALTQPEVASGMFQQILSAPNLVASYQLNGDGADASGNNLNGVLVANPTFVTINSPAGPSVYCTAGTTTNLCNASISASSNPDVAHSNPCQITITSVEGQKTGIVFYGLEALPQPWCTSGGSSFLCVKPPTQRAATQNSGGTSGQCDGVLALDWNAFQLANTGGLGSPFGAGSQAYVQGWFRDPQSCRTTSLSDAVELTYLP
jgi:hypothetical protein